MRAKDDHNPPPPPIPTEEMHYSKDRDSRVKETGEVFTPPELVNKMLDELDYDWVNKPKRTFLDPTCGSGNFLVEIAKRGIHPEFIYGVDLMQDNIDTTKLRLLNIHLANGVSIEDIEFHQERNLVQGDALTYDFSFWETPELEEIW